MVAMMEAGYSVETPTTGNARLIYDGSARPHSPFAPGLISSGSFTWISV